MKRVARYSSGLSFDENHESNQVNIVVEYAKFQGLRHPTDASFQRLRDIHVRYVTVQNSSTTKCVAFAVTLHNNGEIPKPLKTLVPGQIFHLGVNPPGDAPQWLWVLDPETCKPLGHPKVMHLHATDYVLRHGVNMWIITPYKRGAIHGV